jgi:uncharacterized protein (DUF362 family)
MNKVFLEKIGDDLQAQLQKGLEFIEWEQIVFPGAAVFIKPNLTWPDPKPGVTTDPQFVDALLSILSQRAGKLYVGESNGGTFAAEEGFAKHGLPEICRRHGAQLINLSKKPSRMITDTVAGRHIEIEASQFLIDEVDVFITLPVLKTHVVTRVTLGMKNQWGCIPSNMRLLFHYILDWGIVALNRAYNPQITILDGTYAMDRRGPLEGDAIPAGWLAVANNVVAHDAVGCHLLGVEPRSVRHVRFAEMEGLGTADLNAIETNQPLPDPVIQSVIEPNMMDRIAIFLYRYKHLSKLVFDSPFTSLLYKVIGRTPPGTLLGYTPIEDAHSTSH